MKLIDIAEKERAEYNKVVRHPLQSYEWGEFRKKTGVKVIRKGVLKNNKIVDGFTVTLHKIPKTNFNIGYLPKGNKPSQEIISELQKIGAEEKCIFIQLEPNIENDSNEKFNASSLDLIPSHHPLFTKYTFEINLEKSEEELLKSFNSKTRYNIRLAEKRGVKVKIENNDKAFKKYLELTHETTKRQGFYAHTPDYHKKMWETLNRKEKDNKQLAAHLITANYKNQILTTWILFQFHNTLYYPYGASTSKYKNLMASNLIMWEAIKFGKKLGLQKFDLWGALGPDARENDSWYGFHKFKLGYNPRHIEFVGSYDLVINKYLYEFYKIADNLRWIYLKIKR